jgi:hypothetical protein
MRKPKALWRRRLIAALIPRRRLQVFEGDTLPDRLPTLKLALAREGGEDWSIGMYCPCGCGQRLELLVLVGVKPRWDYHLSKAGHVTLHPSVWVTAGCRSHFWLRHGKVIWCE